MGNTIIIGSGISGLLSALVLAKKQNGGDVYIVEKNKEIGGLLRRFYYGEEFGSFDYGMHNILETGEQELDDLIYNLLPPEEWQLLEGSKRDLAGIFFNNKLQYHTPYIDVRNLSKEETEKCISGFFSHISEHPHSDKDADIKKTAKNYASDRFGSYVASKTIIPSVEKVHQKKAEDLDYMATIFTPMNRIAMFDEPLIADLTASSVLRDRLAYSDQRNLPLERSSGRKAMYPVKYGMYRVIDAFVKELKKYKVNILTDSELKDLSVSGNKISEVTITTPEKQLRLNDIDRIVWTGGLPLLARLLKVNLSDLPFDKPLKTIVVNVLLDKPLEIRDLYYFFCYQPGFHTYRLNNFGGYCNGAVRNGYHPICLEFLMNDNQIKDLKKTLEETAIDELNRFGILKTGTKVVFAKAEPLDSGFPLPSVNNIQSLKTIRERIKQLQLANINITGILAEPNLFFQTDVLRDTYLKLK